MTFLIGAQLHCKLCFGIFHGLFTVNSLSVFLAKGEKQKYFLDLLDKDTMDLFFFFFFTMPKLAQHVSKIRCTEREKKEEIVNVPCKSARSRARYPEAWLPLGTSGRDIGMIH